MAGIDGGVGRQQPTRVNDTGSVQKTEKASELQTPAKTSTENLSISHTEGQAQAKKIPAANIPMAQPGAGELLATINTQDLEGLLAGLQAENTQVQDETAVTRAEIRQEQVEQVKKESMEELQSDKAQAEHENRCAQAEMVLGMIFTGGMIQGTEWHQSKLNTISESQQKIATIDLQMGGELGVPAPKLSDSMQQVAVAYQSSANDVYTRDNKAAARVVLEEQLQAGEIDSEAFARISEMLAMAETPEGFFRAALDDAAQNPQATPDTIPEGKTAIDDTAWLGDVSTVMQENQEAVEKTVQDINDAKAMIVDSAKDQQNIAAFRFTSI